MKIQKFTDLIAWQESHKLVLMVYKETVSFPQYELYALTNQIKRSVTSISSNIAEGFSKKSAKEKIQFYHTAKGSLIELQNQLLVARDVGYFSRETFSLLAKQSIVVHKLINGLMRSCAKLKNQL